MTDGLHFEITGDNSRLVQSINESQERLRQLASTAEQEGGRIDSTFASSTKALASFASVGALAGFGRSIIAVRSEIEGFEISLRTFLDSGERASILMQELTHIASTSPLDLSSLAGAAETLLGFGVEANKVLPILKQIGDISGGNADKLKSLSLAFAQASSTGKLMGQDLLQMINAGFNPLVQMSKDTGRSIAQLKDDMTKGAISVEMLENAYRNATSEGGQFYGMLEEQGKGLSGAVNTLSGAWNDMLNEIGKSNSGVIKSGFDMATSLVKNYEAVGNAIMTLVAIVGIHKVALVAQVVASSAMTRIEEATAIRAEHQALEAIAPAEARAIVARQGFVAGSAEYVVALRRETTAILDKARASEVSLASELRQAVATKHIATRAVVEARTALQAAQTKAQADALALRSAQSNLASIDQQIAAQQRLGATTEVRLMQSRRDSAQTAVNTAAQQANSSARAVNVAKAELQTAVLARGTAVQQANTLATQRSVASRTAEALATDLNTVSVAKNSALKSLGIKVTDALSVATAKLNAVMMANKFTLIALGVAAIAYALYQYATRASAAERAQQALNEAQEEFKSHQSELRNESENLVRTIQDDTATAYQQIEAWERLKQIAPELTQAYTQQSLATETNTKAVQKMLNEIQDKAKFDKVKSEIDKLNEEYKELRSLMISMSSSPSGSVGVSSVLSQMDEIEEKRKLWEAELTRMNKLKEKATQDPAILRIEAEANLKQAKEEFDKAQQALEAEKERTKNDRNLVFNWLVQVQYDIAGENLKNTQKEVDSFTSEPTVIKKTVAEQIAENRKALADVNKRLAEARNANSTATEEEISTLEKRKKELESSIETLTGRKVNGASEEARKRADELRKLAKLEEELQRSRQRAIIDQEQTLQELINKTITDARERRTAEMELDHERTMETIKRQREDYLTSKQDDAERLFTSNPKNKNKVFDRSSVELSADEEQYFQQLETLHTEVHKAGERERALEDERAMRDYLAKYGSYLERRQALIAIYEEKAKQATTQGEKLAIKVEGRDAIADLDAEAKKYTSTIYTIFGDMRERSSRELRTLADEAEQILGYITAGEYKTDSDGVGLFGITKEEYDKLKSSPEKLRAIQEAIKGVKKEADDTDTAFGKLATGLEKIFNAEGNSRDLAEGLKLIGVAANEATQATGFLSESFRSLADATGSEALSSVSEGLSMAGDAMSKAMQGAQAGGIFGPVGVAAGAAVGAITSVVSSISKMGDARHERRIQALQGQIDKLNTSYSKLGKEIERAYSSDASKLIAQQDQILRQKQTLLRQQIAEENAKKDSDKGKIRQWQAEIDAIGDTIKENAQRAKDAIFGGDIKSAIEDFANAYANAWSQGESRAESARNFVKRQIRAMILESIKAQTSPEMQRLRDAIHRANLDGIITASEEQAINAIADGIQRNVDRVVASNSRYLEDGAGNGVSAGATRGFQAMSQDTASELNGRFTAIQHDVRRLTESLAGGGILEEMRTLSLSTIGLLERIARHTAYLPDMSDTLNKIERNTKRL